MSLLFSALMTLCSLMIFAWSPNSCRNIISRNVLCNIDIDYDEGEITTYLILKIKDWYMQYSVATAFNNERQILNIAYILRVVGKDTTVTQNIVKKSFVILTFKMKI